MIGSPRGIDILPLLPPPLTSASLSRSRSLSLSHTHTYTSAHLRTVYLRARLFSPLPLVLLLGHGCRWLPPISPWWSHGGFSRALSSPSGPSDRALSGSLHANTRSINLLVASDTAATELCLFRVCQQARNSASSNRSHSLRFDLFNFFSNDSANNRSLILFNIWSINEESKLSRYSDRYFFKSMFGEN